MRQPESRIAFRRTIENNGARQGLQSLEEESPKREDMFAALGRLLKTQFQGPGQADDRGNRLRAWPAAVLLMAAVIGSLLPAARAARVDVVQALRAE